MSSPEPAAAAAAPAAKRPGHSRSGSGATPAATGVPAAKEVQLLTLKVMRLTKPKLQMGSPVTCEPADVADPATLNTSLEPFGKETIATVRALPNFALGEVFGLPQSFGSIFLGEVFCSYLSVFNESQDSATAVSVTAELQTGSDRALVTPVKAEPKDSLEPGGSMDIIVKHEVKELGTHLLVCSVAYLTESGEKKTFRKFFRFQVYKPLDIKTMVYNVENDVILEAQIQNITQSPMFIQKVDVLANELFKTADLNVIRAEDGEDGGDGGAPRTTFDAMRYLNPQDVRQYLYCLSAADGSTAEQVMAATTIGKLEIVWRTNLGELGRLQTNALPRMPIVGVLVGIQVLSAPSEAVFGKLFAITCRITNKSTNKMDLSTRVLQEKVGNVKLAGVANRSLGVLEPAATLDLHLDLIALSTGLQAIRGLGLFDAVTKKQHELTTLPHIFVVQGQ